MASADENRVLNFLVPKEIGQTRIRLGRNTDGGYVVFEELIKRSRFYVGFGVGDDVSFESDLIKAVPGITGRIYDGTIKSPPSDTGMQFCNENVDFRSGSKYFDFEGNEFICKMDIEGEEYNLPNVGNDALAKCDMMVVEIHYLDKNLKRLIELVSFLDGCGFVCAHTHGNNCVGTCKINGEIVPQVIEATLVKSNGGSEASRLSYPIAGLDFPCNKSFAELSLDFIKRRQNG